MLCTSEQPLVGETSTERAAAKETTIQFEVTIQPAAQSLRNINVYSIIVNEIFS
jgi:hypothetical protein